MVLIKQSTLDILYGRCDIEEIISDHVCLKRTGAELTGLCPFHEDKSPSFSVSPSKNLYFCFGCQAGGNAIKFLMEIGRKTFPETILDLAQRYGVEVEFEDNGDKAQAYAKQIGDRHQLLEIMELATKFYEHSLRQPHGEESLTYLRGRGLSDSTIERFRLGYALGRGDPYSLSQWLIEIKGYSSEEVIRAGLAVHSDRGLKDRFQNRVIVPIFNRQGAPIAFGGRAMGQTDDYTPKYLNSPETLLFIKKENLYGLNSAASAITRSNQAIVVEGYFDVISLHAAGIQNVVASMGTALSGSQIQKLVRLTEPKRVVFNLDADKAGIQAVGKAIENVAALAYRGDIELRILTIPSGKDADGYLRDHSVDDYRLLVQSAPLWIDWQIQQFIGKRDLQAPHEFSEVCREIATLLGKLADATLRSHYVHSAANILAKGMAAPHLSVQLEEDLMTQVKGERWGGTPRWQRPESANLEEEAGGRLLIAYLHSRSYRSLIRDLVNNHQISFSSPKHRFLWQQMLATPEGKDLILDLQERSSLWGDDLQLPFYLILDEQTEIDLLNPHSMAESAVTILEQIACEQRVDHLWEAISAAVEREDTEKARDLYSQYQAEQNRITDLKDRRTLKRSETVPILTEQMAGKNRS